MDFRHLARLAMAGAVAVLLGTGVAEAQEDCEGNPEFKPRGGKWVASAELYIKTANQNTKPEDKLRNFQQAADVLKEGFLEQPNNPRNYLMAGDAHVGLAFFGADSPRWHYEMADSVWTAAESMWSCYGAMVDTARYNAWTRAFNRGVSFGSSDQWENAIQWYENAWTVYDKLPQPQLQIGTYYAQVALEGDGTEEEKAEARAKAIDAFNKALAALEVETRLRPEARTQYHQASTFNLAQLLAFEERYEEAAQAYETFFIEEPDNFTGRMNYAVVIVLAANEYADEAEETEEGPAKEELLAKEDSLRQTAAAVYEDLLESEDLSADDYFNIGAGALRLGETDMALTAFTKALELEPYSAKSLEQLAFALFTDQRYDTLIEVGQVLVDRYPLNMNNLAILANAYRETDRSEEALAMLERREALELEVVDLNIAGEEGNYALIGALHNISLEPQTPVQLEFDFYNVDEQVATVTVTINTADQGTHASFRVPIEVEGPITGFTYRRAGEGEQTGS